MALTKKDLGLIKELLAEERQYLRGALDQQSQDIKRDIRDEMDARFAAFENKVDGKLFMLKKEIRGDFLDVLQQNILPAIDRVDQSLRQEIVAIRRHVGMV
jgi:hypothetical protein